MQVKGCIWRILGGVWLVSLWLILTVPMVGSEDYGSFWPFWLEGHGDKLIHFGLFLANGFFLDRMIYPLGAGRSLSRVGLILALGIGLGSATEWVQQGVVGRTAEVLDLLADGVGAGCYSALSLSGRSRFLNNEASGTLSSNGSGEDKW